MSSELKDRIDEVRSRIENACRRAGRDPDGVTLVAVSKTFSLEEIQAAAALGLRVFGENKAQEMEAKHKGWPSDAPDVSWHMIGHLQRNKASIVAERADVFHALDSMRLARRLDQKCQEAGRVLLCLVQVNVSGEDSKYGIEPEEVSSFLAKMGSFKNLSIRGLMTLAAPTEDPEEVRPQFQRLKALAETTAEAQNVSLDWLSMGMSGDFEVAIEEGATHVRVGSAIFGSRSYE